MKTACLGWGSLIWKPGDLPVIEPWRTDGPALPVEFCRVGDGGELSTALCFDAPNSAVLWTLLTFDSLALAIQALRHREGIPDERSGGVGSLQVDASSTGTLGAWARRNGLDAVIWTDLPPRIDDIEGRVPSQAAAIAYLRSLSGETLAHARSYIEAVPAQIDTPHRRAIAAELGWR